MTIANMVLELSSCDAIEHVYARLCVCDIRCCCFFFAKLTIATNSSYIFETALSPYEFIKYIVCLKLERYPLWLCPTLQILQFLSCVTNSETKSQFHLSYFNIFDDSSHPTTIRKRYICVVIVLFSFLFLIFFSLPMPT